MTTRPLITLATLVIRQAPRVARVMIDGVRVTDDYGNEVRANPRRYAALGAFGVAQGNVAEWAHQIEAVI